MSFARCYNCKSGEMSEWLKEHAWKVCIRKRIEGSNPSLSTNFVLCISVFWEFGGYHGSYFSFIVVEKMMLL